MQLKRSYHLFTLWGVPVFIHWTAAALLVLLMLLTANGGVPVLLLAGALFILMLAHEFGHASLAHRLGYRVHWILLSPVHGLCVYDQPRNRHDACVVAWGGVSAQATILLPAAALWSAGQTFLPNVLNLALVILTYYNLALIAFNLSPVRPFDGATAWGILRTRRVQSPTHRKPER
jgi:Zn-dependent protease